MIWYLKLSALSDAGDSVSMREPGRGPGGQLHRQQEADQAGGLRRLWSQALPDSGKFFCERLKWKSAFLLGLFVWRLSFIRTVYVEIILY